MALPALEEAEEQADAEEEQEVQPEISVKEEPWMPSQAEKDAVQLAHNNMGHPKLRDFARLLRRGGCRDEIVRWTLQHF